MTTIGAMALGGLLCGALVLLACRLYARRKADKDAKQMVALLAHMEELAKSRSNFVANVTHELKTPLTSIKGYMELLKDGPRDEETRRMFYDIIDIEADRLHTLINDLLQLSQIEHDQDAMQQATCDLHVLGQELLASFRPQAEKAGVALEVRIPEGLHAQASAHRVKQMLTNLIDNGIKYNRRGGTLLLRAWHEGACTMLCVSDTGIGIEKTHIPHVFERFYRVDKGRSRDLGGTGLGLSIVKHVAQLYGGSVQVESKPGKGSIFTVQLPFMPFAGAGAGAPASAG